MKKSFKNIELGKVFEFQALAEYRNERIISHSILNNDEISIIIFAMAAQEEISEETVSGAELFIVLEGVLQIDVKGEIFCLEKLEALLVPPQWPYALFAENQCKLLQIDVEGNQTMENKFIRKLPMAQVFSLEEQIDYEPNKIVSLSLVQRDTLLMTLFALDKYETMGGHSSTGDAMVYMLDGKAEITVGDEIHIVEKGQTLIMPANIQHGLKAVEAFKMLLTVVKPKL